MASRDAQEAPRRPQEAPREPQGAPRGAKTSAGRTQDSLKTAPSRAHVVSKSLASRIQKLSYIIREPKRRPGHPRSTQEAPRDAPEKPTDAQEAPRDTRERTQEAPKRPQEASKRPQEAPRDPPEKSRRLGRRICWLRGIHTWVPPEGGFTAAPQ